MTAFGWILVVVAVLLWVVLMANGADASSSDAAGRGLALAFGVLTAIVLWIVLAGLLVVAASKGGMPGAVKLLAVVLVPASAAACCVALELLSQSDLARSRLPIVVPVLGPLLIGGYVVWLRWPAAHAAVSSNQAAVVFVGGLAILSILPWPLRSARARAREVAMAPIVAAQRQEQEQQAEADRQQRLARFEKLGPDSPLWLWLEFTDSAGGLRDRALEGISKLSHRQADAELMLEKGMGGPLLGVADLGLEATPRLCELARKYLRERIAFSLAKDVATVPFSSDASQLGYFLDAMRWLVDHGCDLTAEIDGYDKSARRYPESKERAQFLSRLAALRPNSGAH
jgi:hypothetical protein